jgi:hypothetical protein
MPAEGSEIHRRSTVRDGAPGCASPRNAPSMRKEPSGGATSRPARPSDVRPHFAKAVCSSHRQSSTSRHTPRRATAALPSRIGQDRGVADSRHSFRDRVALPLGTRVAASCCQRGRLWHRARHRVAVIVAAPPRRSVTREARPSPPQRVSRQAPARQVRLRQGSRMAPPSILRPWIGVAASGSFRPFPLASLTGREVRRACAPGRERPRSISFTSRWRGPHAFSNRELRIIIFDIFCAERSLMSGRLTLARCAQ